MGDIYGEYANIMYEPPAPPSTIAEAKPGEGEDIYYFDYTAKLEDDSGDSVWIPGGFGVTEDSATDADDGIVITDGTNEFVWIPVPDYTTMYEEVETPIQLSGSDLGVTATTNVYSKLRIRSGDNYTAGMPNSTISREPDILIDTTYGDANTTNYWRGIYQIKNVLGITGNTDEEVLNNYGNSLVEEYTATYESIKKYKGFYIGRYELTGTVDNPTVKKGDKVLDAKSWYELKKSCNSIVNTTYAQSEMIYGNQWDEVMSWLISTGEKTESEVNEDSSSWGNYDDEEVSGYSEEWKANNIYDLAGNYSEWTQEANGTSYRSRRGRATTTLFSYNIASNRYVYSVGSYASGISTRPMLYIK